MPSGDLRFFPRSGPHRPRSGPHRERSEESAAGLHHLASPRINSLIVWPNLGPLATRISRGCCASSHNRVEKKVHSYEDHGVPPSGPVLRARIAPLETRLFSSHLSAAGKNLSGCFSPEPTSGRLSNALHGWTPEAFLRFCPAANSIYKVFLLNSARRVEEQQRYLFA
jgi:hypothetical protein